jgi:Beta-galactosidase trimerisation domain.
MADRGAFEFMTSRCPDLNDHTTMKQKELLEAQAYLTLAHKGGFLFIDAIDPAGTLNENVYKVLGEIYNGLEKYEKYIEGPMELCCDVGIFINFESFNNMEDNSKNVMDASPEIPFIKRAVSIAKSLLNEHIPFGIVTNKNLDDLFKYQVIILPDELAVDGEECLKLKDFVKAGGSIYAGRNVSLLKKDGQKLDDFLLSELFGVSWLGETEESVTYISPNEENRSIFPGFSDKYPLTIYGSQNKVRNNDGAKVLATITLPYTNPKDPGKFASAISNPPGSPTDYPAVIYNKYGKGKVIYTSGDLDSIESYGHGKVFTNMVRMLLHKPSCFSLDAPKCVEMTLFHQKEKKRYIISLVNFQSQLPNIPITGIKTGILMEAKTPLGLKLLPVGTDLEYEMKDGYLEFAPPQLDTFLMVELKYA